jgi:hypothetical protein
MCAWIEVHQSLPTHPKTIEAAMLLDVAECEVVGHLVCLWTWALDATPDGRLDLSKPRIIARAAQWEKEPGRFVDALVAVRFVDDDGAIHDWYVYTGRLMERRERVNEQTRTRMQSYRERKRQRVLAQQERVTPGVTRNTRNGYAAVTPGYAPTVPNPTVPNQPSTTPVGGGPARKADASAPPADAAPVAHEAPPTGPRGNPKVAAVIDALRAEGMTGTLKPADRQALTHTEYPAGDVASLYAAIYRGEYGDEFMHTGLSVANCVNRWMDGWQSHRAGHRAPDRRSGNGNGHAPDKTSALQKTLEVISDELGFDPTSGGPTGPGAAPRGGGAARGERGTPDPAVGGGQAGGGLRPQLPRPPDD